MGVQFVPHIVSDILCKLSLAVSVKKYDYPRIIWNSTRLSATIDTAVS